MPTVSTSRLLQRFKRDWRAEHTASGSSGYGSRAKFLLAILAILHFDGVLATGAPTDLGEKDPRVTPASQAYWVEELASGLRNPFSLAWLPDGDVLITERRGGVRLLRNGELDPTPLSGTPASFQNDVNGLKDILVDPDYQSTHALYLLLSEGTYEQHHTAVYRARYERRKLVGIERIFRAREEMGGYGHSSARILFLPDKTLLVAVPEGHYRKTMAQRLDTHIGKILRINRDGTVPVDNPFLNTPNALPEIWSYGHRVPTGLFSDTDGSFWEVEPGPRGGDELNRLTAGGNFGWAKATWGFEYNGGLVASMQAAPGIESPVLVWSPSVTPSGLTRYRGRVYGAWDGDFFVGHLSGRALERLRIIDRKVVLRETMLMDLEERIREVKVGPDNHIYILTDNSNGRLLRLQPASPRRDQLGRVARKLEPGSFVFDTGQESADPIRGKQAFIERCSRCHRVGTVVEGGDVGPDLAGVYGRRAGTKTGFNYSPVMANSLQVWNFFFLDLFLADPAAYMKGTTMSIAPMLDEPSARLHIIEFLKQQSTAGM